MDIITIFLHCFINYKYRMINSSNIKIWGCAYEKNLEKRNLGTCLFIIIHINMYVILYIVYTILYIVYVVYIVYNIKQNYVYQKCTMCVRWVHWVK